MAVLDKAAVVYQVVLTKTDKISPAALKAVEAKTLETISKHTAAYPVLFPTSSMTKRALTNCGRNWRR